MGSKPFVRAASVCLLLVVALAPAAFSSTGCTGDDCSTSTQTWGSCMQGEWVDDYHWQSSPIDGPYLNYPGGATWVMDPSPWMGKRTPSEVRAYLSFDANPFAPGASGTSEAAGNLAEGLPPDNPWEVNVFNATCAAYYLRVVVEYPETGTPTAGSCRTAVAAAGD
jgi:hypothetical protein